MPRTVTGRARYRRILRFAAWHIAVTWWFDIVLPRVGLRRVSERNRGDRMVEFARRFRVLAVELGGLMIKVGQYMSSRLDVLPEEITKELEGLQDEVPAVPFADIKALVQTELGLSFERVYAEVDTAPVAAASLGQVYRVRLSTADAVEAGFEAAVVKVQRPGIDAIVDVDLAALRRIARWISRLKAVSKRADVPALIEEFATTSLEEIDYLHEGQSAERFASLFADDPTVTVPRVAWERTTRRVLTLEDVTAIKVSDTDALRAAGISPADVANRFAEVMFDQFFIHGFFHADPHPGNIFVSPGPLGADGPPWSLVFVDFGMMGEVPATLRANLRKLLVSAAARDGKGIVAAMRDAEVLLPGADVHELEVMMTKLFARFGGMGFAELRDVDPKEFVHFADEFGDLLLSQPFQLPENFLLIGRAASLTSGLCSSLDPSYNLWDSVEPYAQQLLKSESGNLVMDFVKQAVDVAQIAWGLPSRVDSVISRLEDGTLPVSVPKVEAAVVRIERIAKRAVGALLFVGLLVAGAVIYDSNHPLGITFMAASAVPFLYALFGARR
ncbi:ABC1 kinase family protein [Demequina sp.]|uniref:ABC1 kinase family protein n=1 Tax=Demequina sp. TaxID=2050685 RepID=UPI003D0A61C7